VVVAEMVGSELQLGPPQTVSPVIALVPVSMGNELQLAWSRELGTGVQPLSRGDTRQVAFWQSRKTSRG
jgi:hypothetical protein